MSDESISVVIDGAGLSFKGKITLAHAAEIIRIAALDPDKLNSAQTAGQSAPRQQGESPRLSLSEALIIANPQGSAETIGCISAWMMDVDGAEFVTRSTVSDHYREARLTPPGNMSRDFSKTVRKGYLAPIKGSSDQFYVTRTGRALLDGKEVK